MEELRAHLRQERVPEDQPAEAGPAKYPYTNNTVADFVDIVSMTKVCSTRHHRQTMHIS